MQGLYTISIKPSALKELACLPKATAKKAGKAIDGLAVNPRPEGVKKLKGSNENLYRIRVGDYRIIYLIEDEIKIVDIRRIGHRKDIYK
ncbi:MAG: type II toxin-antitoxin system RelE/ParE family toxin [Ferruginibacter sp.]